MLICSLSEEAFNYIVEAVECFDAGFGLRLGLKELAEIDAAKASALEWLDNVKKLNSRKNKGKTRRRGR